MASGRRLSPAEKLEFAEWIAEQALAKKSVGVDVIRSPRKNGPAEYIIYTRRISVMTEHATGKSFTMAVRSLLTKEA